VVQLIERSACVFAEHGVVDTLKVVLSDSGKRDSFFLH
jgi:hypothetical protein